MEVVAKENMVTVIDHEAGSRTEEFVPDPMQIPWKIMEGWKPQFMDELPDIFCGMITLLFLRLSFFPLFFQLSRVHVSVQILECILITKRLILLRLMTKIT